eukprot:GHVS01039801.1.p1 GENE.GHVS01039801.1~~GHVS01039801.1.p1  ORF type:complete len:164 (+),score=19.75 GHVS01039801.1:260-751(+)
MDTWGYRIVAGIVVATALLGLLHSVDLNLLPHRQTEMLTLNRTQLNGWIAEAATYLGPYAVHAKYASGVMAICAIALCFSLFVKRVNRERQQNAQEEGQGQIRYCVNRMTDEEFDDKSLTRKAVIELLNSPEFEKLRLDKAYAARFAAAANSDVLRPTEDSST